jgi:hypothetical protein
MPSATPRYLGGVGAALSIAGSSDNVAIATGSGQIFYLDPASTTPQGSVSLTSGNVQLSSDGSVLAAWSQDGSLLNIYSLPSGTVSNTFNYSALGLLTNYNLSASGTTLEQIENTIRILPTQDTQIIYLEITPVSGSPTILSLSVNSSGYALLSPDGTLAAVTDFKTVTIYQNGQLIGTVGGLGGAVGWIDNSHLLVNFYVWETPPPGTLPGREPSIPILVYAGCNIVSPTGEVLAATLLPELNIIQPVTSDTVYQPSLNVIYSLTTGQAVWTSPYPWDTASSGSRTVGFADEERIGAISGPYVVYESDGEIIAVRY